MIKEARSRIVFLLREAAAEVRRARTKKDVAFPFGPYPKDFSHRAMEITKIKSLKTEMKTRRSHIQV